MEPILKATIRVLRASEKPLDAYQIGRRLGCAPMEAGRALRDLHSHGHVLPSHVGGDSELAEEFALARAI